ncbi:DUF5916 domain-containing protein [Pontibacter toksunensis]|uniref:DUF5916 domain-containing protein n=1 Tax=Pontibacter toksunensis TaxID=1332631 RepID=A0ABW6BYB0_9BACT
MNTIKHIIRFVLLLEFLNPRVSFSQHTFEPPVKLKEIYSSRVTVPLVIDGTLNETAWKDAKVIRGFKQVEPLQGESANFDTEVRVLFDDTYLYIGAYCKDTVGVEGLRTPNLTRDFSFENNDLFGFTLDPFNTRRNAVAFQVTPYGTQRDLQVFDDAIIDLDWDALWYSKTSITDAGWYVEIAVPLSTIRYPKDAAQHADSVSWGINFIRVHRRSNETSAFPGFPRSLGTYRMTYVAALKGIDLPPAGRNIRLNPYVVQKAQASGGEQNGKVQLATKVGGDLKWGITEHSTLDLTVNTDFAQADVDRQVINLTRFSVYFPERRQFFLENSGLFVTGDPANLQPFFSRRIGLDAFGNPIPLLLGARYTDRQVSRSIGMLYALQDDTEETSKAHFSVMRYIKNYGKANHFGVMLANKYESGNSHNTVATVNGVHRFGERWSLNHMWSSSFDHEDGKYTIGSGSNINLQHATNKAYFYTNHTLISEKYNPEMGFISRENLLAHNLGFIPIFRPSWKPEFVRSYQPGILLDLAQQASDLKLQEGALNLFPVFLIMSSGSVLSLRYQYNWQHLDTEFHVLGTPISPGSYTYNRYRLMFNTDLSRKFSVATNAEVGGYFNGSLVSLSADVNYAPIPNIFFTNRVEFNSIKNLGKTQTGHTDSYLLTSSLRLALNPNVQLVSLYQYNSFLARSTVNLRMSWQFKPLSFMHIIYNTNRNRLSDVTENQGIMKINFAKHF